MERHERYDPEDIEGLLSERGFDELLPDERAFVLRHLSGREEYERMRALLHYVRPDERDRGTIEPEDRVRTNVLEAFRAQQQPQWRIWLNGISLWLAPNGASASPLWRPALAFGSLALLIVAGIVAVRQFDGLGEQAALAEVEQEERAPAPPPVKADEQSTLKSAESTAEPSTTYNAVEKEPSFAPVPPIAAEGSTARAEAKDVAERYFTQEDMASESEAVKFVESMPQEFTTGSTNAATAPAMDSHVVTAAELSRNMSITNTQGEIAARVAAKTRSSTSVAGEPQIQSRSVAEDANILSLVAAGW